MAKGISVHEVWLFMYFFFAYLKVPLGVLLNNETNHDDMIAIIRHLQQYVPHCLSDKEDMFHQILLGGDQLSTAMVRRVQAQRRNSTSPFEALNGVIPVCEDWHTKLCLLTVNNFFLVFQEYLIVYFFV